MSFLNALASDGLSVGLRFYTARMSRASEMASASIAAKPEEGQTLRSQEAEQLAKPVPPPPPKEATPEELAAGRSEAQAMLAADGSLGVLQASAAPPAEEPEESDESEEPEAEGEDGEEKAAGNKDLSEEEQQQVQEMKKRDQEVRTHEQAHMSAGGGLAGSASYEYQTGPDGQKYAVGGEVPISTRGGGTPEQQLRDAETVKRAAMAPAEPSSQDRSVAAQASADINRLRGEAAEARRQEMESGQAEEAGNPESTSAPKAGAPEESQKAGQFAAEQGQAHQADQYGKKMDGAAISAPKRLASNGESFGSHVLSAYATAKFGYFTGAARPALARA